MCTHTDSDLATLSTVGYGLNWMQLSLDDDSEDEDPLDPCKELTEYLESKREERKEGLVEWWGVSMAHISSLCPTNRSLPYASTIPFTTPPFPALHKTILPFKAPQLLLSVPFQVVGSQELTYAIDSRLIHLRHSKSSRVPIATGFSVPVRKQQVTWLLIGISVDSLIGKTMSILFRSTS